MIKTSSSRNILLEIFVMCLLHRLYKNIIYILVSMAIIKRIKMPLEIECDFEISWILFLRYTSNLYTARLKNSFAHTKL
jgi:hypothetical protein